jgi:Cu2+-containing amine oxidase
MLVLGGRGIRGPALGERSQGVSLRTPLGRRARHFRTDKTEVRRSRKLVVSFIATVGNYEYAF